VLGLSKDEINACYDEIVRFADIGGFIDQPVKTYSSGMMVRLAFAVQAQIAPKILVVDEALAVGDARFQMKCFERLRKLKEAGTSIILVTHSVEQIVTHCSKAILLEAGHVVKIGAPKDVVNVYMDLLFGGGSPQAAPLGVSTVGLDRVAPEHPSETANLITDRDVFGTRPGYNPYEFRWGDGAAKIMDFVLTADNQPYPAALRNGRVVTLLVTIKFFADIFRPIFGFTLKTKEGVTVYGANSETLNVAEIQESGRDGQTLTLRIDFDCRLASGDYFLSLGIASKRGDSIVPHDRRYDSIHLQVEPNSSFFGLTDIALRVQVEDRFNPALC
jgi:lipopolysaccharide transport system ATP-binding protein